MTHHKTKILILKLYEHKNTLSNCQTLPLNLWQKFYVATLPKGPLGDSDLVTY